MSLKADLGCYLGKVGAGQAEKHRRRRKRVEITLVLWGVEDLSDTRGTKELWVLRNVCTFDKVSA